MEKENSRSINRRSLLKGIGIGAAAGALGIFGARNAAANPGATPARRSTIVSL